MDQNEIPNQKGKKELKIQSLLLTSIYIYILKRLVCIYIYMCVWIFNKYCIYILYTVQCTSHYLYLYVHIVLHIVIVAQRVELSCNSLVCLLTGLQNLVLDIDSTVWSLVYIYNMCVCLIWTNPIGIVWEHSCASPPLIDWWIWYTTEYIQLLKCEQYRHTFTISEQINAMCQKCNLQQ